MKSLGKKQAEYVRRLKTARRKQTKGGMISKEYGCCALSLGYLMVEKKPDEWVSYNALRKKLGFSFSGMTAVWNMNDQRKASFREIGKAIEADPNRFFERRV